MLVFPVTNIRFFTLNSNCASDFLHMYAYSTHTAVPLQVTMSMEPLPPMAS